MFRPLYHWTLRLAGHRHAVRYMAGVSFAESSFFPIPPDVMLVPMMLARREEACQGLAPDRSEELLVLVGDLGELLVHGVAEGDGRDLAEQDDPAFVAEEGVGVAQGVDPGGDGGGGERLRGRDRFECPCQAPLGTSTGLMQPSSLAEKM